MAKKQSVPKTQRSAASKFGQMIGESFEKVVIEFIKEYLKLNYPAYELLEPEEGSKRITLELLGGNIRQLDTVITELGSADPVALLETKWLKDARHHNDKGSWILQLREMQKKYPTVRGATAVLVGYWTEGVAVMFMSEGGIEMVLVATDEEVYNTLQKHLDKFLGENTFELDPKVMRDSNPRPQDLVTLLLHLQEENQLYELANSWLNFEREKDENGNILTGKDLIKRAIERLLTPLPSNLHAKGFQVTLEINSGNIIHERFDDMESAMEFIRQYSRNSEAIREKITPKKRIGQQKLPF